MSEQTVERKLRVGVVLGGMSSEKEISLESGRNIYFNLNPSKYEGIPLFLDSQGGFWQIPLQLLVQNTTVDIVGRLEGEATRIAYEELKSVVDFVYIGLHGKYGEDGCLQGLLELLGLPYIGSGVMASAIGMDKHMQRRLLASAGLRVPKYLVVSEREWQASAEKPHCGWPRVPFMKSTTRSARTRESIFPGPAPGGLIINIFYHRGTETQRLIEKKKLALA